MKKALVLLTALATFLALAMPAVAEPEPAQPQQPVPSNETGDFTDETPTAWFIELAEAPTADGGSEATIEAEKDTLREGAEDLGIELNERQSFSTLWNGVSAEVSPDDAGKLGQLDGVKAVYPVFPVAIPEVQLGNNPELATAIQMTGADIAQSELGLSGSGINVAVMDTGIDYHNPDLGGAFGPGNKVAVGYDFVGDAYNADPDSPNYNPVPAPDDDPDDCNGHGTHVAGIVGADGEVTGVAPGVTLGAYRVFGCEGSTETDVMLAAMERALADGMDILNMSIGSPFSWPGYPTAVGADNLVDEGVVVVASIGNSGDAGTFAAGAPGVGEKVIGVASFDNTNTLLPVFTVNGSDVGYITMAFSATAPSEGTEEIVYLGRGCLADPVGDADPPVPPEGDPYLADPAGKVALIERGVCAFGEKATRAINAGATAVVVHNNNPGGFSGTLGAPLGSDVPVVGISLEDGLAIRDLIDAQPDDDPQPVEITWTDRVESFVNPTGGLISSFSSYGLAPDLSVKPDIGAPGGSIYSTYPVELGGHATVSGTSMASPHVAGAAALLLEARPDTAVSDVRDIFQNSADPQSWSLAPSAPYLDHVHRQGAGMLDVDDSILTATSVSPGKIGLGETEDGAPIDRSFTVTNHGDEPVTFDLAQSEQPTIATTGTYPSEIEFWLTGETITMPEQITLDPGTSTTVDLTFEFANMAPLGIFGGYVTLTEVLPDGADEEDEPQVLRVPYAGFHGDYQDLTVLEPNQFGLPWLSYLEAETYNQIVDDGHVFTMEDGDVPYVLAHLHHQSDKLAIDLYNARTGRPVHHIWRTGIEEDLLPRNETTTGFFAWEWDGERVHNDGPLSWLLREVPDGDYYFVLTVEKALGDPEVAEHVETWESPTFTVDRPNPWLDWLRDLLDRLRSWRP